jgi:predicted nuclease of restriction endonuclease-like RecB superfamily
MLKSELIRPRLAIRGGQVWTRRLPADYRYLTIAGELTALFERHVGHSRGALAEALRDYEGDSLDYPVIRGLAAVLQARCTYTSESVPSEAEGPSTGASTESIPGEAEGPSTGASIRPSTGSGPPVKPADLRAALFRRGPVTRKLDLFSRTTREQILAEAAAQFGLTVERVEAALFADLAEEQILLDPGEPLAPVDLIARYNLELARGLLYWAREVRLRVHDGYKDLFKYIKLFKLMYTVRPLAGGDPSGGYHITLHGPISPFVKSTLRYGVQFAKFLPALLLCQRCCCARTGRWRQTCSHQCAAGGPCGTRWMTGLNCVPISRPPAPSIANWRPILQLNLRPSMAVPGEGGNWPARTS